MRFHIVNFKEDIYHVYDGSLDRFVPQGDGVLAGSELEMHRVSLVLNQRVERPELTRADGKVAV